MLNCLTGFGEARRMTQFKDKSAKQGEGAASVGLFTYPILQAADILLYRPHFVPVGEDQRQHLELTRDLAQRFNSRYKRTFRLPEPYILKATAKIGDLQEPTAKMSKSASSPNGIIEMLDDPKVEREEDPVGGHRLGLGDPLRPDEKPGISNLLTIYSALSGEPITALEEQYAGQGYGALKGDLADLVVTFVTPFRERTLELLDDQAYLTRGAPAGRRDRRCGRRGDPARRLPAGRLRRPAPRTSRGPDGVPTIGVAIAIPEPWATELQDYRLGIGDPTADGVPSHITLIPPLEVGRRPRRDRGRTSSRRGAAARGLPGTPARNGYLPARVARRVHRSRGRDLPVRAAGRRRTRRARSAST